MASKPIGTPKKPTQPAYVVEHPHILNATWTIDQINAHADGLINYLKANTQETWIWTYFTNLLIAKSTASLWSARSEYFSKLWEVAKAICEERKYKFGCNREYNGTMFIFALKNADGWRSDPAEVDPEDHELEHDPEGLTDNV